MIALGLLFRFLFFPHWFLRLGIKRIGECAGRTQKVLRTAAVVSVQGGNKHLQSTGNSESRKYMGRLLPPLPGSLLVVVLWVSCWFPGCRLAVAWSPGALLVAFLWCWWSYDPGVVVVLHHCLGRA